MNGGITRHNVNQRRSVMKANRVFLMISALLLGLGVFAAEGDAPRRGPEGRGGRGFGKRMDYASALQLNEEEKAAVQKNNESVRTACKSLREKLMEEAKKNATVAFEANLKVYKTAAARLTDEEAKAKAEKMISRMETNKDRFIELEANRALMPERSGMRGPRQEGARRGQRGPRPENPEFARPAAE